MASTWQEDIIEAFENRGGIATYDELYAELERLRNNLSPEWKSSVRRRIQDLSSDSQGFKDGDDLFFSVDGLGKGVWGLRSHLKQTPRSKELPPDEDGSEEVATSIPGLTEGNALPGRASTTVYRILRDTVLARKIKLLHENTCQICRIPVIVSNDTYYAEAHHIIPLGKPHNGPDIAENIIVLCPNHHALMDYGAIRLDVDKISSVSGHSIGVESVEYHNTEIFSPID